MTTPGYTWLEAIAAQRERDAYRDTVADGLHDANLTPWGDDAGPQGHDSWPAELIAWQNAHADNPTLEG